MLRLHHFCITLALGLLGCGSATNDAINPAVSPTNVSLVVSPNSKRLRSGTTQQFDATASLSDGTSGLVNSLVNWASNNPAAVTVSNTGLATGQSLTRVIPPTRATISASYGSLTSNPANVTLVPPIGTIEALSGLSDQPAVFGLCTGPDNNVWLSEFTPEKLARVNPETGAVTEFNVKEPNGICVGPDGNLWVCQGSQHSVSRVTPAGVVTTFSAGINGLPAFITSGPDGNLWFTEPNQNLIGKITTAGVVTEFFCPFSPYGICVGPDGNLWVAQSGSPSVVRVTPAGVMTTFNIDDGAGRQPLFLCSGPDGRLWFTQATHVGAITTSGVVTQFPDIPGALAYGICTGPDGNLWFADFNGAIQRVTPTGVVTKFTGPLTQSSIPFAITNGPDGNLWFGAIGPENASGVVVP